MRFTMLVLLVSALSAVGQQPADACTAFLLGGGQGRLMGVNYDWNVSGGLLVVNPMGMNKTALVRSDATPATWRSRFGSVTFNQYGREFPIGGMNQMGLAMHALWLDGTTYPDDATGPAIDALQWVQYCLDSYPSVREVVDSARAFAISSPAPLHFLACDRSGSCAVIEFIDGAAAIRAADELPLPVLTNSTYKASIAALDRSLGYGGKVTPADVDDDSLDRFMKTANALHTIRPEDPREPLERAFAILDGVASKESTQWRIVYDLRSETIQFVTRGTTERSLLDVGKLDFHCLESGTRTLDLSTRPAGDVASALEPYRSDVNLELVRRSIAKTEFLQPVDDAWILEIGRYPDSLECSMPRRAAAPRGPGPTPYPVD